MKEQETIIERVMPRVAHGFIEVARRVHRIEFDDESAENLFEAQDFLQTHPNYAALIVINHISTDDPRFAIAVKEILDPEGVRAWYGFVSELHLRDDKIAGPFVRAASAELDINYIPTIQQKVKQDPKKYGYTWRDIVKNGVMIVDTLHDARAQTKGLMGVASAFEGTRTKTGGLQEADSGANRVLSELSPAIVVPTAIRYDGFGGRYFRDIPNVARRVLLRVGPYMISSKPSAEFPEAHILDRHEVMYAIADLLPTKVRGVYAR